MINIFPHEKISYQTYFSDKEVMEKLEKSITMDTIYTGECSDNKFKLTRNINYRNSFLPIIKGKIDSNQNSTIIDVNMQLHILVRIFMSIWVTGTLISCIVIIYTSISEEITLDTHTFIPFFLFFFGIVFPYIGFKYESKKSIEHLKEIFEAEII